MKKFLKNNHSYFLVGIYVLLIISVAQASIYANSKSKYVDNKDQALVYHNDFYQLYKGTHNSIEFLEASSNRDNMIVQFSFDRNNIGAGTSRDRYYLTIPTGCSIWHIDTKGSLNEANKTITYNSTLSDTNTVFLTCNVNPDSENNIIGSDGKLNISVTVEERVGTTESKFTYLKYNYTSKPSTLNEYQEYFPIPLDYLEVTKSASLTMNSLYEKLKEYMENVYFKNFVVNYNENTKGPIQTAILGYIEVFNPVIHPELTLDNVMDVVLPGLDVSFANNKYVFKVTENFVGYALTSYYHNGIDFYFSTDNNLVLEEAFNTYINNLYPGDENINNRELINEYLNYYLNLYNSNIGTFIKEGTPKIEGIVVADKEIGPLYHLNIQSLLEYASHYRNSPVLIQYNTLNAMRGSFWRSMDSGVYGPDSISGKMISQTSRDAIKNINGEIYKSITKNNNSILEKVAFNDYFSLYDEQGYYLIVDTSSDGGGFNYLDIQPLMFNNVDVSVLQFTNNEENPEQLDITIEAIDKNKILEVVEKLNTILKVTVTTFDEALIVESDNATITYTVTKEITSVL